MTIYIFRPHVQHASAGSNPVAIENPARRISTSSHSLPLKGSAPSLAWN